MKQRRLLINEKQSKFYTLRSFKNQDQKKKNYFFNNEKKNQEANWNNL